MRHSGTAGERLANRCDLAWTLLEKQEETPCCSQCVGRAGDPPVLKGLLMLI